MSQQSADDPTPQGDALPLDDVGEVANQPQTDADVDALPPGAFVDEESGPVPEPNEPA